MTGIGTAVIGYGYWGVNLTRNVAAATSTELIGVCDPDEDRRKLAESKHPGIRTWASLQHVLDDESVNAVVLATPASTHFSLGKEILEAGRHLMVEKPLAETVEHAEALNNEADIRSLVLMVGHTFLYSEPVHHLKGWIDSGELGNISYLYSQRLSLGRIRRDTNALWNFAPHDISIMNFLLGESPAQVTAKGFSFIQPGIEDVCFASLTYPSGVGANLHVSWIDPRKTRLMTVVGDEKMAIYNDVSADQPLWMVDSGVARSEGLGEYETLGDFQWRTRAGDILIPRVPMSEPLLAEIEAFGRAATDGTPVPTDGRHGLEVVKVLTAIEESTLRNGRPVDIEETLLPLDRRATDSRSSHSGATA